MFAPPPEGPEGPEGPDRLESRGRDAVPPGAAEPEGEDSFDRALDAAIAALPEAYRAQLATVAIVVADEATPDELAELRVAGLYGLYRGIPRTTFAAAGIPIPNVITLYRGPLERDHRSPRGLASAVEETLRHELAHHLGISDRRLDELKGR
jgi:predicted Zn-dependent protease with MMP-like domain